MQQAKTKLGLELFDQTFGGIYVGRPVLVYGRKRCGKSILALQFIIKTLKIGERVMFFTDKRPDDVIFDAKALDFDILPAISSGQMMLLSYRNMRKDDSDAFDPFGLLPLPEAINEFKDTVSHDSVSHVVFDTVVPWLALPSLKELPNHIDNFVTSLNRLNLTSLLLLPHAVSEDSRVLAAKLEEVCPISINIKARDEAERVLTVIKYQGNNKARLPQEYTFEMLPGKGLAKPGINTDPVIPIGPEVKPPPLKHSFKPLITATLAKSTVKAPSSISTPSSFRHGGYSPVRPTPGGFGAKERPASSEAKPSQPGQRPVVVPTWSKVSDSGTNARPASTPGPVANTTSKRPIVVPTWSAAQSAPVAQKEKPQECQPQAVHNPEAAKPATTPIAVAAPSWSKFQTAGIQPDTTKATPTVKTADTTHVGMKNSFSEVMKPFGDSKPSVRHAPPEQEKPAKGPAFRFSNVIK